MAVVSALHFAAPDRARPYRALVERFGSPLMMLDPELLRRTYRLMSETLPGVRLHYAVKALPEVEVLRILAEEGASFDIASSGEAGLLQAVGVPGRGAIHTHPVKTDAEIRAALRYGCTTFVADNGFEIRKLVPYRQRIGLLIRVAFRNPAARVDLARKFGCALSDLPDLLVQSRELGVHVKGLSFHVGSQCPDPTPHLAAVRECLSVFRERERTGGPPFSVLDIGGGFPVDYEGDAKSTLEKLRAFCRPIGRAIEAFPPDVAVWAEPGRSLAGPAVTLVSTVVGVARREGRPWYYLDQGVYGAFSGQIYDGIPVPLTVFGGAPVEHGVLAGPTCDSVDVVREDVPLPRLGIGDVVVATQIGAYSSASASGFNSLPPPRFVVLSESASGPRSTVASQGGSSPVAGRS